MKLKLLSTFVLLFSMKAMAGYSGIYGYQYWYPIYSKDYFELLKQPTPLEINRQTRNESSDPQVCAPLFSNAFAKGKLDVRYALGYFDDSQGIDIVWSGTNYGRSASLDGEVYFAMREVLTQPCEGRRVTCGFQEYGDPESGLTFYKKQMNLLGRNLQVTLQLTHGSASNNFERNKNELREKQAQMTAQSEENFFGGLGEADIIFYNGHSRNGGGPDFNPPVLGADGHPNYAGYYKVKRIGINHVLQAIKKNPNQSMIYGSFSCFSASHFKAALQKVDPSLRMILSSDTIDYLKSYKASLGFLEGLLQGRCGEDLSQFAKREDLGKEFTAFNF